MFRSVSLNVLLFDSSAMRQLVIILGQETD